MKLVTNVSSFSEWEKYRGELLKGFREILIVDRAGIYKNGFKKYKEAQVIMHKIDWRFTEVSRLRVKIRQDHKDVLHNEYIDKFIMEANELIDVLNENFVMEILLGE